MEINLKVRMLFKINKILFLLLFDTLKNNQYPSLRLNIFVVVVVVVPIARTHG